MFAHAAQGGSGAPRKSMARLAKAQTKRMSLLMEQPTLQTQMSKSPDLEGTGTMAAGRVKRAIASTLGKTSTIGTALVNRLGKATTDRFSSQAGPDKWTKATRAAQALDRMLSEPPPMQSIEEQERVESLRELWNSPILSDRVRAYNGLVVHSSTWSFLIGFIIFGNCIAIGVEQTMALNGEDLSVCHALEHVFLTIYTIEFMMNITEDGLQTPKRGLMNDRWFQMDAFLVIVGVTTSWILAPFQSALQGFGGLFVIRTVRLLRLARMVRLLRYKELWTLVEGFLESVNTMVYTTILLFGVTYAFACLGIELITNHTAYGKNPQFTDIVDEYFCNLPRIMLTLAQFIAMDSVAAIYTELVIEDGWLILYFFAVILMVAIVLMNIVTAVIVNTALETNALDREAKQCYHEMMRKNITEYLEQLFRFYDEDGTGSFKLQQLLEGPGEVRDLLCKVTDRPCVEDIFSEIDRDDDGDLTLEEFCTGVLGIVNSELNRETRIFQTKIQTDFMRLFSLLDSLHEKVDKGTEKVTEIEKYLKRGGDSARVDDFSARELRKAHKAADEKKDFFVSRSKLAAAYGKGKDEEKGKASAEEKGGTLEEVLTLLQEMRAGNNGKTMFGLVSPRQRDSLQEACEDGDHKNHIRFQNLPADTGSAPTRPSFSSTSSPGVEVSNSSTRREASDLSTSETTPLISRGEGMGTPKRKVKLVRKNKPKISTQSPPLETAHEATESEPELRIAARPSSSNLRTSNDLFSDNEKSA